MSDGCVNLLGTPSAEHRSLRSECAAASRDRAARRRSLLSSSTNGSLPHDGAESGVYETIGWGRGVGPGSRRPQTRTTYKRTRTALQRSSHKERESDTPPRTRCERNGRALARGNVAKAVAPARPAVSHSRAHALSRPVGDRSATMPTRGRERGPPQRLGVTPKVGPVQSSSDRGDRGQSSTRLRHLIESWLAGIRAQSPLARHEVEMPPAFPSRPRAIAAWERP